MRCRGKSHCLLPLSLWICWRGKKLCPDTQKSLLPANFDILLFLAKCSACATPPSFPYVTLAACFLVTLASAGTWQTSSPCECLCVITNCPLPSIHPPTHLINLQKWPRISSTGNGQQMSWIWQQFPRFSDLYTFPAITMWQPTCAHCWLSSTTIAHNCHLPQLLSLDQVFSPVIVAWPHEPWSPGYICYYHTNVSQSQINDTFFLSLQSLKSIPVYTPGWEDTDKLPFPHIFPSGSRLTSKVIMPRFQWIFCLRSGWRFQHSSLFRREIA